MKFKTRAVFCIILKLKQLFNDLGFYGYFRYLEMASVRNGMPILQFM